MITWTKEEIQEFDRLVDGVSSPNQLTRIECRMAQSAFVAKHGKAKCDAMFRHLEGVGRIEAGYAKDCD